MKKKDKWQNEKCGNCKFFKNTISMPGGTQKCFTADGKIISDRFSKACFHFKKEKSPQHGGQ